MRTDENEEIRQQQQNQHSTQKKGQSKDSISAQKVHYLVYRHKKDSIKGISNNSLSTEHNHTQN